MWNVYRLVFGRMPSALDALIVQRTSWCSPLVSPPPPSTRFRVVVMTCLLLLFFVPATRSGAKKARGWRRSPWGSRRPWTITSFTWEEVREGEKRRQAGWERKRPGWGGPAPVASIRHRLRRRSKALPSWVRCGPALGCTPTGVVSFRFFLRIPDVHRGL